MMGDGMVDLKLKAFAEASIGVYRDLLATGRDRRLVRAVQDAARKGGGASESL